MGDARCTSCSHKLIHSYTMSKHVCINQRCYDYWRAYQEYLDERKQLDDGRQHKQPKEKTMNLYNIAAIRAEYKNADGTNVAAKLCVGPETVLAPNRDVAHSICVRKLSEEDAADLTLIDILVRDF